MDPQSNTTAPVWINENERDRFWGEIERGNELKKKGERSKEGGRKGGVMEYRFTQVFFKEETAKPLVKLIIHSGIGDITKITG